MPWRTVQANIALPLEIANAVRRGDRRSGPQALVSLVGLDGFADAYPAAALRRDAAAGGAGPRADP